ncbi:MAG: Holliday junction resolvase RuvX [Moraxellaceae bacterium]|jgi:putative Holliday junction resolvase|nr:Holliday junction resolvase RuvX [Moraxellaceae bacterium]
MADDSVSYQRVLGFDFGTRRIGVASAQAITGTASPLSPVPARDGIPDWARLDTLLAEWKPEALIVGLPLNMDDTESDLSHLARKFARRMVARYRLPVFMCDERLSSHSARGLLMDVQQTRKGRLPSLDSTAAVLIAEAWLADPRPIKP